MTTWHPLLRDIVTLQLSSFRISGAGNATIHLKTYIYIVAIGGLIINWERYGLPWRHGKHMGLMGLMSTKDTSWRCYTSFFSILIFVLLARHWLVGFSVLLLAHAANLIASLWRPHRDSSTTVSYYTTRPTDMVQYDGTISPDTTKSNPIRQIKSNTSYTSRSNQIPPCWVDI